MPAEKTPVLSAFFKSADWRMVPGAAAASALKPPPTISPDPLNTLGQAGWDKPPTPQTEVKQVPVQQQQITPQPNGGLTTYAQTIQTPQVVHAAQGKPYGAAAGVPQSGNQPAATKPQVEFTVPSHGNAPPPTASYQPKWMAGSADLQRLHPLPASGNPYPERLSSLYRGSDDKGAGPDVPDYSQGWQENHSVRDSVSPPELLTPAGLLRAGGAAARGLWVARGGAAAAPVVPAAGAAARTSMGAMAPRAAATGAADTSGAMRFGGSAVPAASEVASGTISAAARSGPARVFDWLSGTKALRSAAQVPLRLFTTPGGAGARAGAAASKGLEASLAALPPSLAVTGGLAAAHRGDAASAQNEADRDPVKRHLFLGRTPGAETVVNQAAMPWKLLAGSLGLSDGPGLRTWMNDVGGGYADLATAAAHSPRRAVNSVGGFLKDYGNRVLNDVGVADNPVAQYEQLNNEYRALYQKMQADPSFTPEQFQAAADDIRKRVAALDYDPPASTGGQEAVAAQARRDALKQWAASHPDDPRAAQVAAEADKEMEAFPTRPLYPVGTPASGIHMPFPTARHLGNVATQQGLPDAHGVPPLGAENLSKAYQDRVGRVNLAHLDHQLVGAPTRPDGDVAGAAAPAQQVGGPGAVPDEPPVQPPAAGEGELPPGMANPDMPPKQVQESRKAISSLIASTGVAGALAAADQLPRPAGFEKYWGSLPKSSKILAVAGVSMVGISLLRGMFSSSKGDGKDDDEDDESFLMQVLPFLGIGAAAWGLGGGTIPIGGDEFQTPSLDKYKQLGNAAGDMFGGLLGKK